MQMRGGCPSGRADVTDGLPLFYPCTFSHPSTELGKMQVFGDELFPVLQHDIVSICRGSAGTRHLAVTGRENGGPFGR